VRISIVAKCEGIFLLQASNLAKDGC